MTRFLLKSLILCVYIQKDMAIVTGYAIGRSALLNNLGKCLTFNKHHDIFITSIKEALSKINFRNVQI